MPKAGISTILARANVAEDPLSYHMICDDCGFEMFFDDRRLRDMMAEIHDTAYDHEYPIIRANLMREPWTPFNPDGSMRDLKKEGWHHLGFLTEDDPKVTSVEVGQ